MKRQILGGCVLLVALGGGCLDGAVPTESASGALASKANVTRLDGSQGTLYWELVEPGRIEGVTDDEPFSMSYLGNWITVADSSGMTVLALELGDPIILFGAGPDGYHEVTAENASGAALLGCLETGDCTPKPDECLACDPERLYAANPAMLENLRASTAFFHVPDIFEILCELVTIIATGEGGIGHVVVHVIVHEVVSEVVNEVVNKVAETCFEPRYLNNPIGCQDCCDRKLTRQFGDNFTLTAKGFLERCYRRCVNPE